MAVSGSRLPVSLLILVAVILQLPETVFDFGEFRVISEHITILFF